MQVGKLGYIMDPKIQMEQFGCAYVHAVATVAGFHMSDPRIDVDSVDFTLGSSGVNGTERRPRIDIQLKCTSQDVVNGEALHFPLKMKNYNDLRDVAPIVPKILVLVHMPNLIVDWITQSEQELALKKCGYWLSLRGMPESQNTETNTIIIPRTQQLTPDSLTEIMRRINEGGVP